MRAPSSLAVAILALLTLQSNSAALVTTNAHRHAGRGWTVIQDAITVSSFHRHSSGASPSKASSTIHGFVAGGVDRRAVTKTILYVAPQQLGSFERLTAGEDDDNNLMMMAPSREKRRVWLYDFVSTPKSLNEKPSIRSSTVPYHKAWDLQKQLVEHQLARLGKRPSDTPTYSQFLPLQFDHDNDYNTIMKTRSSVGSITPPPNLIGCDSIIMLQHDPVYTLGTASDPSFILTDHNHDGKDNNAAASEIPIVRIERGGEVTYHGPGQLTVYPILDLRGYKQDVHWYMRALEEVILLALEKAGIKGATREENLTGVWVSNKKIAALGIKARRWVTMHGLAINVDTRSLQNFEGIVPCGLEGRKVTCINEEITSGVTVEKFSCHMKEALEEIFCVTLIPVKQS